MDLTTLHQTLSQRHRPEDVAEMLLPLLDDQLMPAERATLRRATAHSLRRSGWHYTSMPESFAPVVGAARQAGTAAELFDYALPTAPAPPDFATPAAVQQLLQELSPRLAKAVGHSNYRTDRLDRTARVAAGLGQLSRRRYNKLFRALRQLEAKAQTMARAAQQRLFQLVGKHGFAHDIPLEEFSRDLFSAAFVAYYTARCNRRSIFTNGQQERPYDEIAEMLFQRCRHGAAAPRPVRRTLRKPPVGPPVVGTNWWAIAHVYPAPEVLGHLTDDQKGQLLGRWTALLTELATFLGQTWAANTFRRESMVVKRGDDSSTWNLAAGAWNKARDNWVNLLYALGMEFLLDDLCPGKVLRLMAADVVYWHASTGGQLDPNTQVWAALPLPWEVLGGQVPCTRATVAAACAQAGLDPNKSGWLAPRSHGVVPFRPTPELVHGVSVASPYLALVLRKNRIFSGKQVPG